MNILTEFGKQQIDHFQRHYGLGREVGYMEMGMIVKGYVTNNPGTTIDELFAFIDKVKVLPQKEDNAMQSEGKSKVGEMVFDYGEAKSELAK